MEDLGRKLQEERLKRNIELQDISNATHISLSVLKDIENSNFSKYTGDEEYIKMYLRKYSDYLGVDSREFVQDYITLTSAFKTEELQENIKVEKEKKVVEQPMKIKNPKFAKSKKVYEDQQSSNYIRYAIIAALIVAIFGVIYFMISVTNKNGSEFSKPDSNIVVSGDINKDEDKDKDKEKDQEDKKEDETDKEDDQEETDDNEKTEVSENIKITHTSPYVYTVRIPSDEESFKVKFDFVTQTWCSLTVNGATYPNFPMKIYNEANITNALDAKPESVELQFNTNETYSIVLRNGHNIGHHYYFNDVEVEVPAGEEVETACNITFNIVKE